MRARAALGWLLALLAGCARPGMTPVDTTRIELHLGERDILIGQGFALTVVRVHPRELVPAPFEESLLRPLELRSLEVRRRSRGAAVIETRRYLAHAFEAGELRLGPLELAVPTPGGAARVVATSAPMDLRVRSAFPPDGDPGPPELPGGLVHAPISPPRTVGLGLLLAFLAAGVWSVARARARRAPHASVGPTPLEGAGVRARQRLAHLQGRTPTSRAEDEALHGELEALLRDFLAEGFDLPVWRRTREELAGDQRLTQLVGAERRPLLDSFLAHCERLRFAPERSTAEERARALRWAGALLASDAPREGSG